ncbi:MAG: biopolymer transporter ExbD [Proteobacteria bacterium]|nr:biopolymer transporter ExbD [Pseudomonadota bacterium]MCH9757602.1 biopolymer transporter ExbD [Pseudomonadota bacterium]
MRRRHRQPISNINVVPYLDVLLVLLVIFMITTPLFNQGVIDLPTVGEQPLPTAQEAALEVIYEEKANNPYSLIDHKSGAEQTPPLSLEELITELDKKAILYEKPYIIISAEGVLPYKDVIKLLGELRDVGYDNIALTAENNAQ